MRRPSAVDPAAGTWAVIGLGDHGNSVAKALHARGIPVMGYDVRPGPVGAQAADGVDTTQLARWGHRVIAVDEIDDIDSLAVTSRDVASHEITTEYFAGVAVCAGAYADWDFIEPEMLNVCDGRPALAHRMFTPRHPAIIVSGPDVTAGLARQAEVIAAYASALRHAPRAALSFHRRACGRLLPGFPRVSTDPVADENYLTVLDRDLASLTVAAS